MDFAPSYQPSYQPSDFSDRCTTPTPKGRSTTPDSSSDLIITPRPRPPEILHTNDGDDNGDDDDVQYGFTLSYLRRAPVLAHMARGVVRAERKRREKELRGREKRKSVPAKKEKPLESTARKMKRLYQKTIRDLYAEGSIVLWEGPCRPCSDAADADGVDRSFLWKSRTGSIETASETQVSTVDSSDELSDPEDLEEAYLPVTTRTVSTLVLKALRTITSRDSAMGSRRRRLLPTSEDILKSIRDSDAHWANLGRWMVDEALLELERDERVFKAGEQRWALCA